MTHDTAGEPCGGCYPAQYTYTCAECGKAVQRKRKGGAVMARYEMWNARGKGACGTLSRVTRGKDHRHYLYATARRDGQAARFAWRYAVDTVEAEARNIRAEWMPDYESAGMDWDCIDDPSTLNRCEFEHDGRHIERGSRSKCKCTPGYGHRHGTLYSDCRYAPEREFSVCAVVAHGVNGAECDRACRSGEYWSSDTCEVLDALHGIEESRDNRERDRYRRDVEAELFRQALEEIHEREAAEMERTRGRKAEYIGRGV